MLDLPRPRAPLASRSLPGAAPRRSAFPAAWALLVCLCLAGGAVAQPAPDLNLLALDWARGRYASPLTCRIDGSPVRGLRRILITPGPRDAHPPAGRIVFVRMTVDEAESCSTDLEGAAPNISGSLIVRLPGLSHTDTALRDFQRALARRGGFEFWIHQGALVLEDVGAEAGEPRRIDFRGGRARLFGVAPGSDAERQLAGLPPLRRVLLEIEPGDGETLRFPLALTEGR